MWRLVTLVGIATACRVAILDTGICKHYQNSPNVQTFDWTGEHVWADSTGHGCFMASLVIGDSVQCKGIARDCIVESHRVFDKLKLSKTQWIVNALQSLAARPNDTLPDIINISHGVYTDDESCVSVDPILAQLASRGVVIVAAAGNYGPTKGTVTHPCSLPYVVCVGSATPSGVVLDISSRGPVPSTGLIKPDVLIPGEYITGETTYIGCTLMKGTSASAGKMTSLLAKARLGSSTSWNIGTVLASIRNSALQRPDLSMFSQGAGMLSTLRAADAQLSVWPSHIDLCTKSVLFWPISSQHLYNGRIPIVFNLSLSTPTRAIPRIDWSCSHAHVQVVDITTGDASTYVTWLSFGIKATREVPTQCITCVLSLDRHPSASISLFGIPRPSPRGLVRWDMAHSASMDKHGHRFASDYASKDKLRQEAFGDSPFTNHEALLQYFSARHIEVELNFDRLETLRDNTVLLIDPELPLSDTEITWMRDAEHRPAVVVIAEWFDKTKEQGYRDVSSGKRVIQYRGGCDLDSINTALPDHTRFLHGAVSTTLANGAPFRTGALLQTNEADVIRTSNGAIAGALLPEHNLALFGDSACWDMHNTLSKPCTEITDWLMAVPTHTPTRILMSTPPEPEPQPEPALSLSQTICVFAVVLVLCSWCTQLCSCIRLIKVYSKV